jgi:hypothetical protein
MTALQISSKIAQRLHLAFHLGASIIVQRRALTLCFVTLLFALADDSYLCEVVTLDWLRRENYTKTHETITSSYTAVLRSRVELHSRTLITSWSYLYSTNLVLQLVLQEWAKSSYAPSILYPHQDNLAILESPPLRNAQSHH